jgi:hypothetical protein
VTDRMRKALARRLRCDRRPDVPLPPDGQIFLPEHFKIYFRSSYAHLLQDEPAREATQQAEERAGASEHLPPPPPSGDLPALLQADMAHAKRVSWNFLGVEEGRCGGGRAFGGGGKGGKGGEHGVHGGDGGGSSDEGQAVAPCEDATRMAEILRSCSALVGMHPDQVRGNDETKPPVCVCRVTSCWQSRTVYKARACAWPPSASLGAPSVPPRRCWRRRRRPRRRGDYASNPYGKWVPAALPVEQRPARPTLMSVDELMRSPHLAQRRRHSPRISATAAPASPAAKPAPRPAARPSVKKPTTAQLGLSELAAAAPLAEDQLSDYEVVELHANRRGGLDLSLYHTGARTLRERVDECDGAL